MDYLKMGDFPEPLRLLILKLSQYEQSRLLYPSSITVSGKQIQEDIIQVLETSIGQGESEESLLKRLRGYANTKWP